MFSIRQIQYFVITVDEGSISAAAKVLEVSPQAVSKAVNDMEQSLGRALFTRKSSGLKPTPYGKSLYRKARKTLREIHDLEDYARGYPEIGRSRLQLLLCIPKTANFAQISERIRSFIQRGADIPTTVRRATLEACIEKLAIGTIDAFVTIGKTDLPGFDVHVIDTIDVGALMVKSHELTQKPLLSVSDFEMVPLYLTPSFAFFHETVLESLMRSKGVGQLCLHSLEMSIHGLYQALASEKGCICMPDIHGVDNWLPETTTVPFDSREIPRVPLCLVTDKNNKSEYCLSLESLLVERKFGALQLD